ncbi:MAG: hypothetical protein EPO32_03975 [Anaerolineae bacterium]|nr:MAG: hypothetical protein EPO32_03975 [Anaerolineae bacterium]
MEKRQLGIGLLIFTGILCACPGTCLMMIGAYDALVYTAPELGTPVFLPLELVFVMGFACGMVLIPLGIWTYFFGPRRRPKVMPDDEPIPPAI